MYSTQFYLIYTIVILVCAIVCTDTILRCDSLLNVTKCPFTSSSLNHTRQDDNRSTYSQWGL